MHIDVLDIGPVSASATIVADLADARTIEHYLRMLHPGGVLHATVAGITRIEPSQNVTDSWRFTSAGAAIDIAGVAVLIGRPGRPIVWQHAVG